MGALIEIDLPGEEEYKGAEEEEAQLGADDGIDSVLEIQPPIGKRLHT